MATVCGGCGSSDSTHRMHTHTYIIHAHVPEASSNLGHDFFSAVNFPLIFDWLTLIILHTILHSKVMVIVMVT